MDERIIVDKFNSGFTCKTCLSCLPINEQTGECHRNPPTVQLVMVPGTRSPANPNGAPALTAQRFFPPVALETDSCSQYAPNNAS